MAFRGAESGAAGFFCVRCFSFSFFFFDIGLDVFLPELLSGCGLVVVDALVGSCTYIQDIL